MALGAGTVQVCTAAMVYGFKIVHDLCDGLSNYLDSRGMRSVEELRGRATPTVTDWNALNLNHVEKAVINQDRCIQCGRCHVVCEDTSHQAISATKDGRRHFEGSRTRSAWAATCASPSARCPTRSRCARSSPARSIVVPASRSPSTYANWTTHPNNPRSQCASALDDRCRGSRMKHAGRTIRLSNADLAPTRPRAAHLALVPLRRAVGGHGDVHSRLHAGRGPDRGRHVLVGRPC